MSTGNPDSRLHDPGWSIADSLTSLRIILLPLLLYLMARGSVQPEWSISGWTGWALLVLSVMAVSDLADGWVARSLRITTRRGAIIDAFADHLVQVALLVFFAVAGGAAYPRFPLWLLVVYLARDVVMLIGWLVLHSSRQILRPDHKWHGKVATLLTFALLLAASLGTEWERLRVLGISAAVMVGVSTFGYIGAQRRPAA